MGKVVVEQVEGLDLLCNTSECLDLKWLCSVMILLCNPSGRFGFEMIWLCNVDGGQ